MQSATQGLVQSESKSLNLASESRQRQPEIKPATVPPRSAQPLSTKQPLELEPPAKTNPNTVPAPDEPKRTPVTPNLHDTTATRTLEPDTQPTRNSASCSQDSTFLTIKRNCPKRIAQFLRLPNHKLALPGQHRAGQPLEPFDLALNRPPVIHRLERVMAQTIKLDSRMRISFALAKLYLGDAAETLELIAGIETSLPLRASVLNLQLRAQVALRYHSQARLEEALEMLSAPEVSPLHRLSLYVAVLAALERTEGAAQKLELRRKANVLMQQLAQTLEPELRLRFLEHWTERLNSSLTVKTR